ncbi:MAG: hypothetical protein JWP03_1471 [Phycisphaerales bacterium]|jgi:hypothetical protein|nr:hypothetical protein [Phycisphaerales bacterium]
MKKLGYGMKRAWISLGIFLGLAMLAGGLGCGGDPFANRPRTRVPHYALGFANATGAAVDEVKLDWTADGMDLHDGAGFLSPSPDATKESNEAPDPIPPKATLSWLTADGQKHKQELEVASRVPDIAHFSGTVWFKITPDQSVRVIALTKDEMLQRAIASKPIP